MITSILDGSIEKSVFDIDPIFGLSIPITVNNVETKVLNPRQSWENKNLYDDSAMELAQLFIDNFKTYGEEVLYLENSGPTTINV